MGMPQAIYFDLDGTLFDDRQYVVAGFRSAGAVLEDLTGETLTEDFIEASLERGITGSTFDTVLAEHDLPLDLVPELVEAYHTNDAHLDLYPDARPILKTLGREYALGLISGGRNGGDKLSRLDLNDIFDVIILTSELDTSKREPDPFEAALDTLDVHPDEAVFVGDRPCLDFPQPNRLGMWTIRVQRGRFRDQEATGDEQPDMTANSLWELPEMIDRLSNGGR